MPGKREKLIIVLCCFIAGVRIFVFSAAFPFFCNVDEEHHFDTVFKYSHGYLPHIGGSRFDKEAAEMIAAYSTQHFIADPAAFSHGQVPPPLCVFPKEAATPELESRIKFLERAFFNQEAFSPPVYYITTGLWLNLGRTLGFGGSDLLYWIRFFNILAASPLPWIAYLFARRFFFDNPFMRLGLPLMTAFIPQDAFYSINNDVLSPLLFSIALYLLIDLYFSKSGSYLRYLCAGFLIAITFLTKFSNVAIIMVFAVIFCLKMWHIYRLKLTGEFPKVLLLALSAALPISLWLGRNYLWLGDISGTAEKVRILTWSVKPVGKLLDHPIFSYEGFAYFWSNIMLTFWRGEFVWQSKQLAPETADWIYVISSSLFILVAGIGLFLRRGVAVPERFVTAVCLMTIAFSVIFLAGLSLVFDFGNCVYPSRVSPFLISGRLVIGMLVPFLAVYLNGMNLILSKLKIRINPLLFVIMIVAYITCAEIAVSYPVFGNEHNWFHLEDKWK